MTALRAAVVALGIAIAAPASAATIHGLVYDDANGDGQPSAGEKGIAGAVVAFGVKAFATADASGQFDLQVAADSGIVWVRVPDGFTPGPVWARWAGTADIDLPLHRLASPVTGPLTFVVAADTHIAQSQDFITGADLALAATNATALDPAPAFFTILGDITQGNKEPEFALVDQALSDLSVPWVPVPGNHDWYDEGAAWFKHYGPDNYSFDLGGVHFVVWNMAMSDAEIRAYLGAELSHVAKDMTVVALTHAPPSERVVDALRELGVDYVLTGHAHSNRVVDHDGVIELNTEPFLMGGLDFTPAGYRVITLDAGRLDSYHRTVVDEPFVEIVSPARGACTPAQEAQLIVAAEIEAATNSVVARVDCATPIALRPVGGWDWRIDLPSLRPGAHSVEVVVTTSTGTRVAKTATFEVCAPPALPTAGQDWAQVGGDPTHLGARTHELAPPLVTRWTAAAGGHVLTASPVIAHGMVYVAVTDLADGTTGGIVAFDLATGAQRWRVPTPLPVRGGVAVVGGTVIAPQIDGVVLGLDATTGAVRWRHELTPHFGAVGPDAGAVFAPPATDGENVLVGHQRSLAALDADGALQWSADPVPDGADSQSAAAIAIGRGIAVGVFNRAIGGLIAWEPATGRHLWSYEGSETVAINASPVITSDSIFVLNGADDVTAFDHGGQPRWRVSLDEAGFEWGNATAGTPAFAQDILVVPTLYRDLVALEASTGVELWRHAGVAGPLRTTHYRSGGEAGFEASPVITGDIVWTVDTSGELAALDLHSGRPLWHTEIGVPVLAGLAVSGDWLVAASYDGTIRAFVRTAKERAPLATPSCSETAAPAGCCDARRDAPAGAVLLSVIVVGVVRRRRARRA